MDDYMFSICFLVEKISEYLMHFSSLLPEQLCRRQGTLYLMPPIWAIGWDFAPRFGEAERGSAKPNPLIWPESARASDHHHAAWPAPLRGGRARQNYCVAGL